MTTDRKQRIGEIMDNLHSLKHKILACYTSCSPLTHAQWAILDIVRDNGSIGVKDLSKILGVSGSAITQLTDVLVKKKYLMREEDKDDRRIVIIKLSPGNRAKLKKLEKKFMEAAGEMFSPLTDMELKKYAILNKKITTNLLEKLK